MDKTLIKAMLEGAETPVIMEIGANNGSDTVEFVQMYPEARVLAIEPDPRSAAKLERNILGLGNCEVWRGAIGNVDGLVTLHQSSGNWPGGPKNGEPWDKSSSIKKPTGHIQLHPWCKFDLGLDVMGAKLDTFCEKAGVDKIQFVWADVQGAERDMILGGAKTFKDNVKYLYTEYSDTALYEGQPTRAEIFELLPGYDVVTDFGGDILLFNREYQA